MKHLFITLSVIFVAIAAAAEGTIVNTMNLEQLRGTASFRDKNDHNAIAEYNYMIEFPTMLAGYDVEPLKAAVAAWLNMPKGSGPREWMEIWTTLPVSDEFEPCAIAAPTRTDEYNFGVPNMTIELTVNWFLEDIGVIQIECFYASDFCSGVGASYTPSYEYYIFDLNAGKRVELSDLFVGPYKNALMNAMLSSLEYTAEDNCITIDGVKETGLSETWMIENPNMDCIHFVYGKYEVACGAAGCPKIPVYIPDTLKLTPLGKQLLEYLTY